MCHHPDGAPAPPLESSVNKLPHLRRSPIHVLRVPTIGESRSRTVTARSAVGNSDGEHIGTRADGPDER